MSKTIRKPAETERVPRVRESAQQIWLAGLGALSVAEDEGEKLFKALVKRGRAYEVETRDRLEVVREKLDVRKGATAAVEKISDRMDDGLTQILHTLGLPSKKEIEGLTKRVERLTKTIETRDAKPPRRARPPRARRTPAGREVATV